jgi:pimeloyl-ACP methyl ester carboxylesterase
MSFINIKSSKIYYDQKGDSNKTIVFVHGNSLSSSLFKYQFEDENLLNKYRLIRFDFPGFGKSEHDLEQKTYSFSGFAEILAELYKKLEITNSVLVGNSMGGHIIFEALEYLKGVKGIFINGAPPFSIPPADDIFLPNPALPFFYKDKKTNEELDILATSMVNNPKFEKAVKAEFKKVDPNFMKPWVANMQVKIPKDEIEIVKSTKIPVAVIHGVKDSFINSEYLKEVPFNKLWRDKICEIQEAGHLPFLEKAIEYNKCLIDFCAQQF